MRDYAGLLAGCEAIERCAESRGLLFGELKRARSKHEVELALEALSRSGGLRNERQSVEHVDLSVGPGRRAFASGRMSAGDDGCGRGATNVISFSAAMSACVKGEEWGEALSLLQCAHWVRSDF